MNMIIHEADKWITVKPNGTENKGAHVKIDGESGEVKAGMGGKFTGQKISEIRKDFTGPKTPKGYKKPEHQPQKSQGGSETKRDAQGRPVAPERPDFMGSGYWNGKFYSDNRIFVDGKQKKLSAEQVRQVKQWQAKYVQFKKDREADTKTAPKAYLNVKYEDRNEAKASGAKWDPAAKKWYWDKRSGEMPESLSRFTSSATTPSAPTQSNSVAETRTTSATPSSMTDRELRAQAKRYDDTHNEGGEGYNPYRNEIEKRSYNSSRVLETSSALKSVPDQHIGSIEGAAAFREAIAAGKSEEAHSILSNNRPLSDFVKWSNAGAETQYGYNQRKAAQMMREGRSYEDARKVAEQGTYNWDQEIASDWDNPANYEDMMTLPPITFDAATKRRFDENGFMHVESSHITKEQVAPYRGREIPGWAELGLDPDKIYLGYRPADELQKAADTFNGLPIMFRHHAVNAQDPKKEYQVGSMATNATWNAPYIDNGMIFTDAVGIRCVENGTCREISCAYRYTPDFTPGEFEGKPYDFVMRDIKGNHVAIVEEGRAGPDVVVADSSENLKTKGVGNLMNKLIDFFRGAQDANPGIEEAEVNAAQTILDLHKRDPITGEIVDITEDEDKNAKIQEIIKNLSGALSEEDLKKLEDSLTDLAYSKATGGSEVARKMDGEDDGLNTAEAYAYGEKKEREREERSEIPGGKDATPLNTAEAVAAGERHEREKLMREHLREKANDCMKQVGMDAETDEVKEAFIRGFEYGMHDGEKDMRNRAEREKLDREHEREAMERRLAADANTIRTRIEKELSEKFAAAADVGRHIGSVSPLAFDSADSIYLYAVRSLGLEASRQSARDVFNAAVKTRKASLAMDAAPASTRFSGVFEGLGNLKV